MGGERREDFSNDIKRFKSKKTCILSCSNNKILNDYLAVNSQPGNFIRPHTHTTHTLCDWQRIKNTIIFPP